MEVCLGDFERELATLPGLYAPPNGRLLLAIHESAGTLGETVGCAALRALESDACELKRLYVRSSLRGEGPARKLMNELIAEARSIGYERMVLDTLPSMEAAQNSIEHSDSAKFPLIGRTRSSIRFSSSWYCAEEKAAPDHPP